MSKKTEKKKTEVKQEAKREAVIYLGPEIPGVVPAGMVFSMGLTPQMEKALKEFPAMKKLLVPVGDVVDARKKLRNKMSAISICYERTAEYAAEKGAEK